MKSVKSPCPCLIHVHVKVVAFCRHHVNTQKTGLDQSRPVFFGLFENLGTLGLLTGLVKD